MFVNISHVFLIHVYIEMFQQSSSAGFLKVHYLFSFFKWISYEWWLQTRLVEWIEVAFLFSQGMFFKP